MPSAPIRIERPFTGGKVTAIAADKVRPEDAADLENAIFVNEVAQERNGYGNVGSDDPLGGSFAGGVATNSPLYSVYDAALLAADGEYAVIVASFAESITYIGYAEAAGTWAAGDWADAEVGQYEIVTDYGPELLLTLLQEYPDDEQGQPVLRWAGRGERPVAWDDPATGTWTITSGQKRAAGSGSDFTDHRPRGTYMGGYDYPGGRLLVENVTSNTELGLYNTPDQDASGSTENNSIFGVFGLMSRVTDIGVTSHGSSATTVTGKGTNFSLLQRGDVILRSSGAASADALTVTAVASDTSLTVAANSVGAWTDQPATVLRPAAGNIVCVHENQIFIAGLPWAGDRLQYTPVGYDLGQVGNGSYSLLNDAARARALFDIEVPAPTAAGKITGLASHQSGILVGKSRDLWLVSGQHPGMNVRHLADIGCAGPRSILAARGSVFIAGPNGVWEYDGRKLTELSQTRDAEWREVYETEATPHPILGYAEDHLYVKVGSGADARMWLFDLERRIWAGDVTNETTSGIVQVAEVNRMHSSRRPGGVDRLLAVSNVGGVSGEARVVDLADIVRLDADGATTTHTGRGRFMGIVPPSALGSSSTRKRATRVKVLHTLNAASGTLTLSCSVDDAAFTTEKSIADNMSAIGEGPQTEIARPTSGQLGVNGRGVRVRLQRSAGATTVTRCAVHEIEISTRYTHATA